VSPWTVAAAGPLMARYLAVFLASGHEAPPENAGSWRFPPF